MSSSITCSCPDWIRYNFPCKHILAVITFCPRMTSETVDEFLRSCPFFVVDLSDDRRPAHEGVTQNELNSAVAVNEYISSSNAVNQRQDEQSATDQGTNRDENNNCSPSPLEATPVHAFSETVENELPASTSAPMLSSERRDASLEELQLQFRDCLRHLSNQSYNIKCAEHLRKSLSVLKDFAAQFEAVVPKSSIGSFPLRSRRRLVRYPFNRTALIRRLRAIKSKKQKKIKTKKSNLLSQGIMLFVFHLI
jgi:hypothetical protein